MDNRVYSGKLTGESFLLYELKIVAKLKKEGYTDKEVLDEMAEKLPKNIDVEEKLIRFGQWFGYIGNFFPGRSEKFRRDNDSVV